MLQKVVLETSTPMTLDIESVDPDEILVLESISGLDPAKMTLFTGDFAGDGGYYQGRRINKRNPVFNFRINPDYINDIDASQIRKMLYTMFLDPSAASDSVQVRLVDDKEVDRYFICYAEDFQADIFAAKPKAQVSTICVDPWIKSVAQVSVNDATGFVSTPFAYEGTADAGIEVTLKVKTATPTINVKVNTQTMTLTIPGGGNYAVNDIIYINTNTGSRAIKRNGVDVMAHLSAASTWLKLNQPAITLANDGGVAGDGKVGITNYTYRANWWGI